MVAQIVRQGSETFRGVRPLKPARDLRQVALLLEEAFRQELGGFHAWSRVPILRDLIATLISTAFMPVPTEYLRGFVYEENGQILGNVTLTLDNGRASRWMISNVAVAESHRRRGIARQMMQAALDEARERGAQMVMLNVRPWNTGAIELYEKLGFETVDTESFYVRTRARRPGGMLLALRRLKESEFGAAYQVAQAGMSETLREVRPPPRADFGVRLEDRVAERTLDMFAMQSTERWGYFEEGKLVGVVSLRAQRLGSPHHLMVHVIPAARGRVEAGLVATGLDRLSQFAPRDVEARVLASHRELVNALADAGFIPTRGLTLMAKRLRYGTTKG